MPDIKLNFVNESNDFNNSEVVFFQKNVATDFDELSIAWKVIKNCGTGWHHEFTFPMQMQVSASDSWGNEINNPIDSESGQQFSVFLDGSGNQLGFSGEASNKKEVQVKNELPKSVIDAKIYKSGKLLARKNGVSPSQKAGFEFNPTIWVGVISQIEEGELIDQTILSKINTEIHLDGIISADIVMSGGGTGPNSSPFEFQMENVVKK